MSASFIAEEADPPTSTPTPFPTESPTRSPSRFPTVVPTSEPTFTPTNMPTAQPINSPTSNPTENPSTEPTISPSKKPSTAPTSLPTEQPTKQPSTLPTVKPSISPSKTPSNVPTGDPTFQPTFSPTNLPSKSPTEVPVELPTPKPTEPFFITISPTSFDEPTIFATGTPTLESIVLPKGNIDNNGLSDELALFLGIIATCVLGATLFGLLKLALAQRKKHNPKHLERKHKQNRAKASIDYIDPTALILSEDIRVPPPPMKPALPRRKKRRPINNPQAAPFSGGSHYVQSSDLSIAPRRNKWGYESALRKVESQPPTDF